MIRLTTHCGVLRLAFGVLWVRDQRRETREHQLVITGGRTRSLWERHRRRHPR